MDPHVRGDGFPANRLEMFARRAARMFRVGRIPTSPADELVRTSLVTLVNSAPYPQVLLMVFRRHADVVIGRYRRAWSTARLVACCGFAATALMAYVTPKVSGATLPLQLSQLLVVLAGGLAAVLVCAFLVERVDARRLARWKDSDPVAFGLHSLGGFGFLPARLVVDGRIEDDVDGDGHSVSMRVIFDELGFPQWLAAQGLSAGPLEVFHVLAADYPGSVDDLITVARSLA